MRSNADELNYKNGMFFSSDGTGPYCPVCYMENDGRKNLMIKNVANSPDQAMYECSREDCHTSVFP